MTVVGLFLTWNSSWVCRKKTDFDQCGGAGPLLTGSGSRYFFYTGSGSFSYKNRLKSSKKSVFAFKSSHRLRLRPKSTSSGSATLIFIDHKLILIGEPFFSFMLLFFVFGIRIRIKICLLYPDPGSKKASKIYSFIR